MLMKIAVIGVRGIPAKQGGIERYCQELYSRIVARGHRVDFFVQPKYHDHPWFSISYHQKIRVISLLSLPGKQIDYLVNSALNTIWATFGNYDVIHIHGIIAAWFAWFPQLFSAAKIVVTCHQLDCQKAKGDQTVSWLLPWVERIAVKNADQIIVLSKALGAYFSQNYDIHPCYIPIAPTSYQRTDTQLSHLKTLGLEKKQYFLYLGKLAPERRPDLLIRAFQQLQPSGWKLVLAGDISDSREYAVELLKMAQGQNNIIIINEIRENFLAEFVQGAGLLVVPANESLPLTILEAMGEGIPILASDTPGHRELISHNRGLLFKSEQLNSLISELEYALSQPDLLVAMAHRAQKYVAIKHNWGQSNLQQFISISQSYRQDANSAANRSSC